MTFLTWLGGIIDIVVEETVKTCWNYIYEKTCRLLYNESLINRRNSKDALVFIGIEICLFEVGCESLSVTFPQ